MIDSQTADQLAVARKGLGSAQSRISEAQRQLDAANNQVFEVTERIRTANADDDEVIAALAQERATAQAKVEALTTRLADRKADLQRASDAVVAAEVADFESRLAITIEQASAASLRFRSSVSDFVPAIVEEATALDDLITEANRLNRMIKRAKGQPSDALQIETWGIAAAKPMGGYSQFVLDEIEKGWGPATNAIRRRKDGAS